jgi:hypothetical protein
VLVANFKKKKKKKKIKVNHSPQSSALYKSGAFKLNPNPLPLHRLSAQTLFVAPFVAHHTTNSNEELCFHLFPSSIPNIISVFTPRSRSCTFQPY